jgi:hypothetical protein
MKEGFQSIHSGIYEGIVRAVVEGKTVNRSGLREFLEAVQMNMDGAIQNLRASLQVNLNEVVLPLAMAGEGQVSASSYETLERILAQGRLSRAQFNELADRLFNKSLEILGTAIREKQVTALAPIIFYSPEMKDKLIRYIRTVQQGFEAAGDVTGEHYRISIVSANKAEFLGFISELSKLGLSRGVRHYVVDGSEAGWRTLSKELSSSVFNHPVFGSKFGVFFPDDGFAKNFPVWQRVVRSQVPKEYVILLLPALSLYFAQHARSEIRADTLRQALPDLVASARFLVGQGIAILPAWLEHIAAAAHEISASA